MGLGAVADIKEEIQKINDLEFVDHEGFPEDTTEAGVRWSEVVDVAASGVVPVTSAAATAKITFAADLTAQLEASSPTPFVLAFTNYAVTIAAGMSATHVGTVPPVPISFTSVYAIGNGGGTAEACAQEMATVIKDWFETGTAVINGGGPTIPWA